MYPWVYSFSAVDITLLADIFNFLLAKKQIYV